MSGSTPGENAVPLAGLRLLVAEDEALIAAKLAHVLHAAGADVVGPVSTLAAALGAVAGDHALDAAVIDVDLRGELAFPLCERLAGQGVRFLLITGYDLEALPPPWSHSRAICKPFADAELVDALLATLAGPAPTAARTGRAEPAGVDDQRRIEVIRSGRNLMMESRLLIEESQAHRARRKSEG